ncbi:MAG: glutathione S-transferase N-terminal domain-containing protein, partial [Cyanobium sp.]
MTLTLYGGTRSRASLVRWYLEEKNIPYSWVPIDLTAGEQRKPAFRAINPFGKVPALLDSSFSLREGQPLALYESGAIMLHLADHHAKES